MTTTLGANVPPPLEIIPLNATDICDSSCTAAAVSRVKMKNGELLFCGHHRRKYKEAIQKQALDFHDPEGVLW